MEVPISYQQVVASCTALLDASAVLCDPQTSGGLLVSVDPAYVDAFVAVASVLGLGALHSIGVIRERAEQGNAVLIVSGV